VSTPPQGPGPPPPPPPPDNWQPAPQGQQPPGLPPQPAQQSNGVAIAALVCGIVALVLCWIPVINLLSIALGLVAVILGIVGLRKARDPGVGGNGLAVGGLVTGVVGLLVAVLILSQIVRALSDPEVRDLFDQMLEGEDPAEIEEQLEDLDDDAP
jgi:hypothetical protein